VRTEELSRAPGTTGLLAKAMLGALPGRSRSDRLPDTELVLPDVRVDRDHLARYAKVCGFGVGDELPPTYPHVLAFGLAMRLMTDRTFPFPMVGSVHINNTITQHRPLPADEPLTLRVRTADLRPHERGRQFDVIHTAEVDGEPVWRDVSTYLRRGARSAERSGERSGGRSGGRSDKGQTAELAPASAVWRVGDDVGRRYAAVSGDRNPIHLHPLAARAFGFPRAIAHGMWTKARCLAALQGRLPSAYTVDVAFKLPVLLPARVAFSSTVDGDGWRFALHDDRSGKPHVVGTVTAGR
jgi:acyl dehydratase